MIETPSATIYLKPRKAKPFFYRHPWVFSGAVERVEGELQPGDIVRVCDSEGKFIAHGYANPQSQIFARLLTWRENEPIDETFWRRRLEAAVRLRDTLPMHETTNACRLVNGEGDGLPGLIVDKYGSWLAVQFSALGMFRRRALLLDILEELLHPAGIYDRTDAENAQKEGISPSRGLLRGEKPEGEIEIHEDERKFLVDIISGQKTGFFLDQRDNRHAFGEWLKRRGEGARVLDVFCYTGGFAIAASLSGRAGKVIGIDSSAHAVELARKNAHLNGLDPEIVEFREAVAPEALREIREGGETFDAIVLDPPKFARCNAGLNRALHRYHEVNAAAMRLLVPGGLLVTCSCSQHVSEEMFLDMLNRAAVECDRTLRILARRGQPSDHPVNASCPETAYLKCFFCVVI